MKMSEKWINMMTSGKTPGIEAAGKMNLPGLPKRKMQMAISTAPASSALPVIFLGRRTLQKMYLMLHLGRMLLGSHAVRLDTVNPSVEIPTTYDYCGIEIREYPDSETLQSELARLRQIAAKGLNHENAAARPCAHLADLPDKAVILEGSCCFLVTDSDRNSLEQAGTALQASGCEAPARFIIHRIYMDIWEGSRIGVRYLEEKILRSFPANAIPGERLSLGADERNWAAIIDNQHDDRLRLLGLTSEYRRLLADVASIGFRSPIKESMRHIRLADRRKQA